MTGSLVYPSLEGSRPIIVEVQSLVTPSYAAQQGAPPVRRAVGIDNNRMSLLLAVMSKKLAHLELGKHDVYAKVVGGLKLLEPALDLALAAAIISSRTESVIPGTLACFGEVGLGGEVRPVGGTEIRIRELEKLGFSHCILPSRSLTESLRKNSKLTLTPIETITELGTLVQPNAAPKSRRRSQDRPPF